MLSWESGPPPKHQAVTPSDSTVINFRAIVVGGVIGTAYTLTLTDSYGNDVQYTVVVGQTVVLAGTKVKATGTNAIGLVAQS